MQNYIALHLTATPSSEDIFDLAAASLADIGFDSFMTEGNTCTAYIKKENYAEAKVRSALEDFPIECKFSFEAEEIEGRNWNREWELHYFQPIIVGERCVVHSSFHTDVPRADYDIVIDPKMAFGTGHHSTTSMMMQYLLELPMEGKSVIDMGTGTGILSILATMLGASQVIGIEIDPDACANAVENAALNNTEAAMIVGDASALKSLDPADCFMANINRNVITADIDRYAEKLKKGGTMLLSGFYMSDAAIVERAASTCGLHPIDRKSDKDWCAIRLVKE